MQNHFFKDSSHNFTYKKIKLILIYYDINTTLNTKWWLEFIAPTDVTVKFKNINKHKNIVPSVIINSMKTKIAKNMP